MRGFIPCNKKPFSVEFTVATSMPQRVRIVAWDMRKHNTKYYDRTVVLYPEKERQFIVNFPLCPETMAIRMLPADQSWNVANDNSVQAKNVTYKNIKKRPFYIDNEINNACEFIKIFSERAGNLEEGVYQDKTRKFTIIYENVLYDKKSNQPVGTPARIGHKTGIIGAAKNKYKYYTVPVRFVILMHEVGHVYVNPKIGEPMTNESSADIFSAYISLCEGFPKMEIRYAFAEVFKNAENSLNQARMSIVEEFMQNFEKGQIRSWADAVKYIKQNEIHY